MLFTSYSFIGFTGVLLSVYYLVPRRLQWIILLISSCVFYWVTNPASLIYVSFTAFTIWGCAIMIDRDYGIQNEYIRLNKGTISKEDQKAFKARHKMIREIWTSFGIFLNIGILIVTKYFSFLAGLFTVQQNHFTDIIVPLGISFYSLQAVGYLIDVKRGTIKAEGNLFKMLLFVSFFPQVIQGPISRFSDLSVSLFGEHEPERKEINFALQRILWGYFKKLIVADRIAPAVITLVSDPAKYRGAYVIVALVLYTIELYADFTGGIDISIGVAGILGVKVTENFRRPYFSTSLKEYWRRWHITMSQWFREFVFYPVSTSKLVQGISKFARKHLGNRGKKVPVYFSSFIVWVATGLWHGANWTFIIWGMLNWLILTVSEELEPVYAAFHKKVGFSNSYGYKVFMCFRTILLICILNLFDCYSSVRDTISVLASIITETELGELFSDKMLTIGMSGLDYVIVLAGVFVMLAVSLIQEKGDVREYICKMPYAIRFAIWFALFLSVLLIGAYGIGYDANQFIYNRF